MAWAGPLVAAGLWVATTVDQGRGPDLLLLRDCLCPVWILNGPGAARNERTLAAVNTTPDDDAHERPYRTAMEPATSLARLDDTWLDVVSV